MMPTTALVPALPAPSAVQMHRARQDEVLRIVGIQAAAEYVIPIGQKRYMQVVGLAMLGSAMGYTAKSVSCTRVQIPEGPWAWFAECAVVDAEGTEISRGIGMVCDDEPMWASRPHFARAAMAQTRAQGRALRQCIGWLVGLIGGIEATPAEEMPAYEEPPRKRVVADVPAPPVPKLPPKDAAATPAGDFATLLHVRHSDSKPDAKRVWHMVAGEFLYPDGERFWAATFDATLGGAIEALLGKPVHVKLDGPRDAERVKVLSIEAAPAAEGGPDGDFIPF